MHNRSQESSVQKTRLTTVLNKLTLLGKTTCSTNTFYHFLGNQFWTLYLNSLNNMELHDRFQGI